MAIFRRRKRTPSPLLGEKSRVVKVQDGADLNHGCRLERLNKDEVLIFRTREERNMAARADQVAFKMRQSATS